MNRRGLLRFLVLLYVFAFICLIVNFSLATKKNYDIYSLNKEKYSKIKKELKSEKKKYDTLNSDITNIKDEISKAKELKKDLQDKLSEKNRARGVSSNGLGKTVYFTFDDGSSDYTGDILDTLKKYNIKATFFVTCKDRTSEFVKRMKEEGHTIALHTCSHNYGEIYASEEAYFNDLDAIQKVVKDATGSETKYIRFPGGTSNTVSKFNPGIMTRLSKLVTEKGYKYYDWNIDSGDAAGYNSEREYNTVVEALRSSSRNTNMILMHDIKVSTRDCLERIIIEAKNMGYEFSNITDDTPEIHHGINN